MLSQWLYLMLIAVTGSVIILPLRRHCSAITCCACAFPAGTAVLCVVSVFMLSCSLPFNRYTLAGGLIAVATGHCIAYMRFYHIIRYDIFRTGVYLLLTGCAAALLIGCGLTRISADAYIYIGFGRALSLLQGIGYEHFKPWITATGISLSAVHAGSYLFGTAFSYAFHPLLSMHFTVAVVSLCCDFLHRHAVDSKIRIQIASGATILLLSTFTWLFHSWMPYPNMLAGTLFCLSCIFIVTAAQEKSTFLLYIALLFLTAFLPARPEAILMGGILLMAFMSSKNGLSSSLFAAGTTIAVSAALLYYIRVAFLMGIDGFLHRANLMTMILTPALLVILVAAVWLRSISPKTDVVFGQASRITNVVLSGCLLIAVVLMKENAAYGFMNLAVNAFTYVGHWGFSWIVLLSLFILTLRMKHFAMESIFVDTVTGYFLVLFLLGFLRGPWRCDWADSADRMLLQIFPLVVYYVACKTGKHFSKQDEPR
jgi:hypothetical protein